MADISISLPSLTDIISSILDGPDIPTSTESREPPVTVTITVIDTPTLSSTRSTSTSTSIHSASSSLPLQNLTTTAPTSSVVSGSTSEPESITTTLMTTHGESVFGIATVIRNPGHVHSSPSGDSGGFFSHRTSVIGVFTALGILLFASAAGIIACAAHRRAARRRQLEQQEKSQDRRNFFDDEMNDVITPSEKSWWGNTSGASIPYNTMPMHPVGAANSQATDISDPTRVSMAYSGLESGGTVVHPYANAAPSLVTASYTGDLATLDKTMSGTMGVSNPPRDAVRSPPPSIPLPALPQIPEGTPPTSSEGWESQIQPRPQNTSGFTRSQESQRLTPVSGTSVRGDFHPYASPPTNRRSELYPEDVLYGLGEGGGVGRSLSGRREPAPPMPSLEALTEQAKIAPKPQLVVNVTSPPQQRHPLDSTTSLAQTYHSLGVSTGTNPSPIEPIRMTPEHTSTTRTHSRAESGTGLSDGGWYDEDSTSDRVMNGAAASGESMLETSGANNQSYGYPKQPIQQRSNSANGLAEVQKPPHDPRFSGLFGNAWAQTSRPERDRPTMGSVDESHYTGLQYHRGGSALRVTNE